MAETSGGDVVHGNKVELSGDYRGATLNFWATPPPAAAGGSPPDAPPPPAIFLSYAWGDDQPFVERLRNDLVAAGFRVWRDVEDLPSRGNALRLELREALDAADRFVPVCGPAAAASANVQLEWAYARDRCLPITPVLRRGDAGALPPDFRGPLYFDFRADDAYATQLATLVDRLGDAPRRPGRLHGAFRLLPEGAIPRAQSAQLAELLRPGETARAITGRAAAGALVAAGGLGKSVVALTFMLDCPTRRAFPDGLFWLEFGQSPTVVALQAQVGVALGDDVAEYRDVAGGKARLQGLLQGRKALLVLDDVWDAAHAEALLVHAPDCRWLITSRQTGLGHRLGLPPGHTLRVDRLSSDEGAALIAGRLGPGAGAAQPDEAQHRQIVALLDGHTQAIALAAAHLVPGDDELYLGPAELLRRYRAAQSGDNPFALLALRDDDRQQNLELSLRVSYDHLDADRRRRFRALGAFAAEGAFSTAAAAAVWGDADNDTAGDAARFLAGASLLERAEDGRWRQHALLRAYALALLRRAGEEAAARAAHLAYYAAEYGDHERNHPDAAPGRHAQITADFDDIRHALEWGLAAAPEAACDLLGALENSYLQFAQPFAVRRLLLGAALAPARAAGYIRGEANTLQALGDLERMEDQYGAARERYEAALGLYRAIPARLGEANTLKALGDLERMEAQYGAARERYEAALGLYRAIPDRLGEANTLQALGDLERMEDQYGAARERYEAALGLYRAIPDRLGEANTLQALGDLERMEAQYGAARERYEAALGLFRAIPDRLGEANTLQALGDLERMEAQYGAARERYEAALGLYRAIPDRLGEANTLRALGTLDQVESDLEGAGQNFAAAGELYAAMGLGRDQAVMKAMFAQLRLAQGRADEAIALIREALAYFEGHGLTVDARVAQSVIARMAAMPDFDARWTAVTGQPRPAWLGEAAESSAVEQRVELLVAWIQTPDWAASRDHLRANAAVLLTDAAEAVLGQLAAANPQHQVVADHVALLALCRAQGIDAGYEAFLSALAGAGE